MKARHHSAATEGRSILRDLAHALVSRTSALTRAYTNRRQIAKLRGLDERGLQDIGLTRSDVDRAMMTPWYDDPSTALSNARRAHRFNRFVI